MYFKFLSRLLNSDEFPELFPEFRQNCDGILIRIKTNTNDTVARQSISFHLGAPWRGAHGAAERERGVAAADAHGHGLAGTACPRLLERAGRARARRAGCRAHASRRLARESARCAASRAMGFLHGNARAGHVALVSYADLRADLC